MQFHEKNFFDLFVISRIFYLFIFTDATDLESAREAFERSCTEVDLTPYGSINEFYRKYKIALKEHVPHRYRDIWKILDKKASQKPYQGGVAEGQNVLVIGAGPCGLRTAVETQLLGANTVIIERRNAFTRHSGPENLKKGQQAKKNS